MQANLPQTCNVVELQATKWDLHREGTLLVIMMVMIMVMVVVVERSGLMVKLLILVEPGTR